MKQGGLRGSNSEQWTYQGKPTESFLKEEWDLNFKDSREKYFPANFYLTRPWAHKILNNSPVASVEAYRRSKLYIWAVQSPRLVQIYHQITWKNQISQNTMLCYHLQNSPKQGCWRIWVVTEKKEWEGAKWWLILQQKVMHFNRFDRIDVLVLHMVLRFSP